MTVLTVFTYQDQDGVTAVEVYCGDDCKYAETFPTWAALLARLGQWMPHYASVVVQHRTTPLVVG